jgi:hypothetical protein
MGSALLGTNVITDANDFVVPFIVPNGFKPYVCVMVEAQFYEIHQHTYRPPISDIILYYFTSSLYKKEQQALTVDPPECVTIYPEEEDPVDLPLNQTSGAYVSSIGLRGTNFVVNGNFESTYGWEIHNANVVNDVKHSGSQSMEIENTGHIVQYLSCLGIYGDEAVLSLWGLPQQIGNEALLIVVYEDNSFYYEVLTMTQTVWSQFTSYPAEHKILKEVHICGDIGTVYIDDVEGCITDRFPTRKLIKVCANITWNIEEWKPTILVELTDALGNKFTLSEFQMICSNGTNTCDILCFVPRNAIVGLATINISLWNTWHTNPNAEMYICQSNRECEIIQGPSGGGGGGGGECYLV